MPVVISNTKQARPVDVRPKHKLPREGGRYLVDPDNLDAEPVFLEGTGRRQSKEEKAAAEEILNRGKTAAKPITEKADQ